MRFRKQLLKGTGVAALLMLVFSHPTLSGQSVKADGVDLPVVSVVLGRDCAGTGAARRRRTLPVSGQPVRAEARTGGGAGEIRGGGAAGG